VQYLPLSVISAKVKLADLCKSMLSEYTRVLNARRGSPEKKSVSARCSGSEWGSWGAAGFMGCTDVLQEAQQIGDGLALAVGQHGIVYAVLGATCRNDLATGSDGGSLWSGGGGELTTAAGREELRSEA
jgi:hypothetical protein